MILVNTYLHCAVLFASHPWVLVDRLPSCKDTTRETKNIYLTLKLWIKFHVIFIVQNINHIKNATEKKPT